MSNAAERTAKLAEKKLSPPIEVADARPPEFSEDALAREPRATVAHPFSDSESWRDPMDRAAFQGPAGRFVRLVEPHSEADPVGILGQFLGAFSNAAGRSPHFTVEADRHSLNLYQVHVGRSSKARKGTSWGRARQAVAEADPDRPLTLCFSRLVGPSGMNGILRLGDSYSSRNEPQPAHPSAWPAGRQRGIRLDNPTPPPSSQPPAPRLEAVPSV